MRAIKPDSDLYEYFYATTGDFYITYFNCVGDALTRAVPPKGYADFFKARSEALAFVRSKQNDDFPPLYRATNHVIDRRVFNSSDKK